MKTQFPEKLPKDKLPPEDSLPDKVFTLPEFDYPEKFNIGEILLDRNAEERGDKIAIYYKNQKITYSDLESEVNRMGNALKGKGVQVCDRVALIMANRPEWIQVNMACWEIGAIPVLCSHLEKQDRIAYKLRDSDSKIAFVGPTPLEEANKVKEKVDSVERIISVEPNDMGIATFNDIVDGQSPKLEPVETTRHHVGRIIYTSGTTGKPKGVLSTYDEILATADNHGKYVLELSEEDTVGGHPYFYFAFGSVNFTWQPWRFGSAVSILETAKKFDPHKMLRVLEDHEVTVVHAVPTVFKMILDIEDAEEKYNLSSLRLAQAAGEPLPVGVIEEFEKRFGVRIIDSLGSSDRNYIISTRKDTPCEKLGSLGKPVPGVEAKILDPSNFDRGVETGELGRLFVKGPLGIEYWNKPQKQRKAIFDGWSDAEIIVSMDEDGYLWFKGRGDDIIISAGYKIGSHEIEEPIRTNPAVSEVAVVPKEHEVRGTIAKAYIKLNEGYEPNVELKKDIQNYVKQKAEPYKYPREIEFIDEFPLTTTGKIKKSALRE